MIQPVKPECANCEHLSSCKEASERKILDGYHCRLWHIAPDHVLAARADIIRDLGSWALRYELPRKKLSANKRPKARRRKRNV